MDWLKNQAYELTQINDSNIEEFLLSMETMESPDDLTAIEDFQVQRPFNQNINSAFGIMGRGSQH